MESVTDLMRGLNGQLAELNRAHGGSRFAGEGADPAVLEELAAGGSIKGDSPRIARGGELDRGSRSRAGLAGAMTKAMGEATGSAGG